MKARKIRRQSENHSVKSSGRRSRDSRITNGEKAEAVTLFEVVCIGKGAIQSVVSDWVEVYQEDRDAALLDLLNFYIQCSGCQGVVTAEMFQNQGNQDIVQRLTEEFDKETGLQFKKFMAFPWILTITWPNNMENGDYPLSKSGIYWKKFRANICELTAVLVQKCQYNAIYDGYLLDTVISLLLGLSDSCIRAFRHTSTLSAVKLHTALVRIILNLETSIHNLQRLYNVKQTRLTLKKASHRMEQIEKKRNELQQKHSEIKNMLDALFKGTIVQRYRDVVSDIRALCIEELGIWMKMYPQVYLNDSCLKYIGWMLYDKVPDVRLKSLLSLQGLYENKDFVVKMDLFSTRFKDRIISMTLDRDHDVSVQAMKLLVFMSQNCEDLLTKEDCDLLYQCVYTAYRPLATAAGEFLYKRHLNQAEGEESRGTRCNAQQLKFLLTFFCENKLHEHLTYLVDSLWDCNPRLLKDWQCMSSLLLQDTQDGEDALNAIQQSLLIELLLASVRQAVEVHPPVGRGTVRKMLSAKEKKVQLEDHIKITEHFAQTLPLLLAKYLKDQRKVANLLQILQYFKFEVYSTKCLDKDLEALLNELKHVALTHSDPEVLEACSKAYIGLGEEDLESHVSVSLARRQLIKQLVDTFSQMLHDLLQEGEEPLSSQGAHQMSCVLRKLAAFQNAHDPTEWNLYEKTSQLLLYDVENCCFSVQLLVPAFQCMYYALLWNVVAVMEETISKEEPVLFREHVATFWQLCKHYLNHQDRSVQEQAFMSLCDVLLLLSHYRNGIYCCMDSALQSELFSFVHHHVFQSDEEKHKGVGGSEKDKAVISEGLHKRQNLLAAYCKLIANNIVEMAAASEIYKQYIKAYNDFGDIIKETLSRTRQNDKIESTKTLILCLEQLFQKHREVHGSATLSSPSFFNIKEMARRFSLTFGMDHVKCRESVVMIHKQGIEFAFREPALEDNFPPPNLAFLIPISEFSGKLLKPDKRLVYGYLQRIANEQMLLREGVEWNPLVFYTHSLLDNLDEESSFTSSYYSRDFKTTSSPTKRKPFSGRRGMPEALKMYYPVQRRKRHLMHGDKLDDGISLYSLQPSVKRLSSHGDADEGNEDVEVDEVLVTKEIILHTESQDSTG
ncbi:cohesin subunit SA-2 isoform X2 [Xenopus laevis]|uniref:Cohesin subunit SA n=2 Tax=Xenopus laevis TaxID=8355 RepID=A0A1L8H8Z3_XENLA|nr:cohesin subunit SA-2 isoform X2 [Xenopus laevis]XP_018105316.1 cohesin subunit SA-2 isoform X2 [Xenopus laevis]OCT92516.1 hypothetical protein XELAEV_18015573mg [Xenopus laevis]